MPHPLGPGLGYGSGKANFIPPPCPHIQFRFPWFTSLSPYLGNLVLNEPPAPPPTPPAGLSVGSPGVYLRKGAGGALVSVGAGNESVLELKAAHPGIISSVHIPGMFPWPIRPFFYSCAFDKLTRHWSPQGGQWGLGRHVHQPRRLPHT